MSVHGGERIREVDGGGPQGQREGQRVNKVTEEIWKE